MSVNFGEAIAQGIAQGVGEGYQNFYKDQQREQFAIRQADRSFKQFKKQQTFNMGLQNIAKQNEALGTWEQAAKLGPNELAYKAAVKMAEPLAKADKPEAIRGFLKNFSGMNKAELMVRAGYVKPDYSSVINNPDYQDSIPIGRIGNIESMPNMEQTFKYDPRLLQTKLKKEGEKVTAYTQKRDDTIRGIQSNAMNRFGARLSPEVANSIWQNRPDGQNVTMKGAKAVSYDQTLLDTLVGSGQVVKVGTQLKFVSELTDSERTKLGINPEVQGTPKGTQQASTLYTEPTTEEYITEQKQEKKDAAAKKLVRDVENRQGKLIKSYTTLDQLGNVISI